MSRVVCDYEKCTGCLACVVTCLDHHNPASASEALPMRQYRRENLPGGALIYRTYSCHHCVDAPCVQSCPFQAISYVGANVVVVDREQCRGCKMCSKVCPHGIPQFDREGKAVFCDGCYGDSPACVSICPMDALRLEDS